jgi:hypothetical protein
MGGQITGMSHLGILPTPAIGPPMEINFLTYPLKSHDSTIYLAKRAPFNFYFN